MKVTEGGELHEYIDFVTAYADEIDPLADLRAELEEVSLQPNPGAPPD